MSGHEERAEDERWLPVVGWEGLYEVSSEGRIKSQIAGRGRRAVDGLLAEAVNTRSGYRIVVLCYDGRRETMCLHRIAAAAFLGPRPEGMHILHTDGDASNNAVRNLRYGTPSDNTQDSIRHGTHVHARKTHCVNGHEFTPQNTGRVARHPTHRVCLQCKKDGRTRPPVNFEAVAGMASVREAGEILGVSQGSVYVYAKQYADFPKPTMVGRRPFFDRRALITWRSVHPALAVSPLK